MMFEPSPVWHDDDAMAVDETAKIFLRNVLGKSKMQLTELKTEADQRRKELDNVRRIKQNIRAGKDKTSDEVELVRAMFSIQEKLHEVERRRTTAEIEISTIKAAVGDISFSGQNHNFKSETFKIPTNCDLCGERIWGLSAKGFDCRDCGYTCHSKCELKVPASCAGEQSKEDKKKLKAERQQAANADHSHANGGLQAPRAGTTELPTLSRTETMNSLSSGYAASAHRSVSGVSLRTPTEEKSFDKELPAQPAASKPNTLRKNRIVAPPPTQYVSELPANEAVIGNGSFSSKSSEPRGKMIYAYKANGDGEVSVDEGHEVIILEPDGQSTLCNFPSAQQTAVNKHIRWLRLDASPLRAHVRHCPRLVRRDPPPSHPRPLRTARLILLELIRLPCRQHDHDGQEEGSRRSTETWSEETQLRRSAVRLRGTDGVGVEHERG